VGEASRRVGKETKDKRPGETELQHKFRKAIADEMMTQFKSLLKDGKGVTFRVDVDRTAGELTVSLNTTARPGSPLAGLIEGLGKKPGVGATLVSREAAVNGLLHLALPAKLRKALEPAIDEGLQTALKRVQDEVQRGLLDTLLKGITPTLKAAEIDSGFNVTGPASSGLYTLLLGFKLKEGEGLEKAVKDVFNALPPEARDRVTLDADKVGKVSIHKVMPDQFDRQTKAILGENPIYVAIRDDALLFGAGERGLAALKEALGAGSAEGLPFQVEASLAKLAPLMVRENKGAPAAARKAFKEKGSDKVRLTLEGGSGLKLRLGIKGPVLHFFALLDEMKKKEL
jgi:hypothetical protein